MEAITAITILNQIAQENRFGKAVLGHKEIVLPAGEKSAHNGENQWWAVIGSPTINIESDNGGYSKPNASKSNEQRHLHTGEIILENPGASETSAEFLILYIP